MKESGNHGPDPADLKDSVTEWLALWRDGEEAAVERITAHVYQDLRRLAAYYLSAEQNARTLTPTALVHEAYLQVMGKNSLACQNRTHFIATIAKIMRRVLVDHARARNAEKRRTPTELPGRAIGGDAGLLDVLAVDQALIRLSANYPRHAQVVELRFFGGLEFAEIAETIDKSLATVERDWRFARAWLQDQL